MLRLDPPSGWPMVRRRRAAAPRRVFLHNQLPPADGARTARAACGAFGGRVNGSALAPADLPYLYSFYQNRGRDFF